MVYTNLLDEKNPGRAGENLDGAPGSVLVVGGGVTGIQASLDLSSAGFKVYLVERSPALGGVMAQLDKTFPTLDCSLCILSPKLVEAGREPNIELITHAEVESAEKNGNGHRVTILRHPRYVNEDKCIGCGVCARKCPVKVRSEFDGRLGERRAIYIPYAQAVPLTYLIDPVHCRRFTKGKCGICAEVCPNGAIDYTQTEQEQVIDVGSIILTPGCSHADAGGAAEYGYGRYANVVTSLEFERIISASGPFGGHLQRISDGKTPQRIAFIQCVGSRSEQSGRPYCSSVCCTYAIKQAILAKEHDLGVSSTIFFMDRRTFGKNFEQFAVRARTDYGVEYRYSAVAEVQELPGSKNLLLYYTDEEGRPSQREFDLVVLSVGLETTRELRTLAHRLGVDTDEYGFVATDPAEPMRTSREGIYVAGTFSGPKDIPDSVTQGAAAAGEAVSRLAYARYSMVTPRQYPEEIDVTGADVRVGVFVCHCGANISGIVNVPAVVAYAKTVPGVTYATDNVFTCSQDTQELISAAIKEFGLNRIVVAACTPRTHEVLFKETLRSAGLNPYLFEFANIRDQCSWVHQKEPDEATRKAMELVEMSVSKAKLLKPLQQIETGMVPAALVAGGGLAGMTAALEIASQGFDVYLLERENDLGGNLKHIYSGLNGENPQVLLADLKRRIAGSRSIHVYLNAELSAVKGSVGSFETTIVTRGRQDTLRHGVTIIATGAEELSPTQYRYGEDERIVTLTELERRITPPGGVDSFDTVVMIQCVGSRDEDRPYCSRICCVRALKNAIAIKSKKPASRVFILYRDLRAYGFSELYFRKARGMGVVFTRFEPGREPRVEVEDGRLTVSFLEPALGEYMTVEPDLLALSPAIVAKSDSRLLAEQFKVPVDDDGFFLEAHMKLRPVEFATDGVFICGLAHSPKSMSESISQAKAAAAKAASMLAAGRVRAEGIIAQPDMEKCTACGTCMGICPYGALSLDVDRFIKVNAILCKGCGTCAAACPERAIEMLGFTDAQLSAQVSCLFREVHG